jgi:hypothetical protein
MPVAAEDAPNPFVLTPGRWGSLAFGKDLIA